MSVLTKILLVLYPVVIYLILRLIFRGLRLKRYTKVRVIDIFTFFLMFGLNFFLRSVTPLAFWPYYLMLLSSLGLVFLLIDIFIYQRFTFPRFFKRFWRTTYLVTLAMYLCLIVVALF